MNLVLSRRFPGFLYLDSFLTGSGIQGRQPFADGKFGEFGDAMDFQLFHNVAAMGLYGLDAYVELVGDLLGRITFRK